MSKTPPRHYTVLDYAFVHPLSRQGCPLGAEEWTSIFLEAGAASVEHQLLGAGTAAIYFVRL